MRKKNIKNRKNSSELYVSNICWEAGPKDIKKLFTELGAQVYVHLPKGCKGIAFVSIFKGSAMNIIKALDGFIFMGRHLKVSLNDNKNQTVPATKLLLPEGGVAAFFLKNLLTQNGSAATLPHFSKEEHPVEILPDSPRPWEKWGGSQAIN